MRGSELKEGINQHVDEVFKEIHDDNSGMMKRLDDLEGKLEEHRKEVSAELKEIFGHLYSLKDLLHEAWWKLAGVICTFILVLFGAVFTWIWDKEQAREAHTLASAAIIGETMGIQKEMSANIHAIADAVEDTMSKKSDEHDVRIDGIQKELDDHLKEVGEMEKAWKEG